MGTDCVGESPFDKNPLNFAGGCDRYS